MISTLPASHDTTVNLETVHRAEAVLASTPSSSTMTELLLWGTDPVERFTQRPHCRKHLELHANSMAYVRRLSSDPRSDFCRTEMFVYATSRCRPLLHSANGCERVDYKRIAQPRHRALPEHGRRFGQEVADGAFITAHGAYQTVRFNV